MMRYLLPALLALGACSLEPAPEKKITVILRNSTDQKLDFHTQVGFLGNHLQVPAGYTWRGWVPRDLSVREIVIEILRAPEPPGPPPEESRQGAENREP